MKKRINKKTENVQKHSAGETRQVFVFELDGEEYAVEVENVEEIIRSGEKKVTNIPNVPDFIKGIINVRGQVVPLMDLEEKFELDDHDSGFIVIIEIEDSSVGVLVDDVKEVMRVESSKIKEAPSVLEEEIHADYIQEVAVLDERMIIIIDIAEGLSSQEAVAMEELSEMQEGSSEEDEKDDVSQEEVEEMAKEKVEEHSEKQSEEDSSEEDSEEDAFTCDECGDEFDSKRGLASHKAQVH